MHTVHRALLLLAPVFLVACPDPPKDGPEVELGESGFDADGIETREAITPPDSFVEDEAAAEVETSDMEVTVLACAPGAAAGVCDDSNPCTDDGCDATGHCFHIPNLAQCDDGDLCTVFDRCNAGTCQGGPKDCDDQNACTLDSCVAGDCEHSEVDGPCDDADLCTGGDHCEAGACVGSPVECPGAGPCATASCDSRLGCQLEPAEDGWTCEDANDCTRDSICIDGACLGVLVDCDDDNPCTDDHCSTDGGCSHRDNHAACDDGDRCTEGDRCQARVCSGQPLGLCCASDCDDGDVCTADACVDGVCASSPALDLPAEGQVIADFESALDGWSLASTNAEVAWHLDASWAASGSGSLYCGASDAYSYDRGATLARAAMRIAVPPVGAELHLVVKADVDGGGSCVYDVLKVLADGVVVGLVCGSGEAEHHFSLADFGGREVELALVFDTVDDIANAGQGIWVDRMRLTAASCAVVPVPEPGSP